MDATGRVLIAQRPAGKHLAGGWEFPGGKLEVGETRVCGLARELREEIGISIELPRPLIRIRHVYPYGEVLLDVFVVQRYVGEPTAMDGQAIRWCHQDELPHADLLPADRPIIKALRLPERLTQVSTRYYELSGVLRDDSVHRLRGGFAVDFPEALAATTHGAEFIVLREILSATDLATLCNQIPVPVYARGIELEAAWASGATGVCDDGVYAVCRR